MKPVNYLTNTATGIEGEPGVFYNYILASDGVYLRAQNALLSATVNIARQEIRGLAPLQEEILLRHGKIPLYLLNLAISVLCTKPDIEQYLAITWENNSYSLKSPQEGTGGAVTYETFDNTVMDIHSHTGGMPAEFTSIDDADEQGFRFSAVAADLRSLFPTITLRLGIYGYFLPLEKSEVFKEVV
ncbi:MAG: hypothetical protein JXA46_11780 [Dehalococcoidales bacterium]|nr:hypothetical protein [Dehalococcoidales bacterium]